MNAVLIFGPSAVGKMTVGTELMKKSGYKLFHNHMVIELVYKFWGFAHPRFGKVNNDIRKIIFTELGRSGFSGIIFTYVWALDEEDDHKEILSYFECMGVSIKDVLFVELEADQETRLERNKTEFRIREKPSKNNIKESEGFIFHSEKKYKLNSDGNFFYPEQHLKIDNTQKSPAEVAQMIYEEMGKRKFHLTLPST